MENQEVRYYQPRFARWIKSNKWDSIAENLSDTCIAIIIQVMNANSDGDCSWVVWKNCDYVLDRIRDIDKKMKG